MEKNDGLNSATVVLPWRASSDKIRPVSGANLNPWPEQGDPMTILSHIELQNLPLAYRDEKSPSALGEPRIIVHCRS